MFVELREAQHIARVGFWQFDSNTGTPVSKAAMYDLFDGDPAADVAERARALSAMQLEILRYIARGMASAEIADACSSRRAPSGGTSARSSSRRTRATALAAVVRVLGPR